jgi:hypothetical protein
MRNGVQPSPSRPIVCITMSVSMKSTDDSARLRTPFGGFRGSRRAAITKMITVASTAATPISATLLNDGKMSGHTRMWLISGNSRANTFT